MSSNVVLMYSPTLGHTVPDGIVDDWFTKLVMPSGASVDNHFCQVGSAIMVERARLGLLRGEIDSLTVRYQGTDYKADENADFDQALFDAIDIHLRYLSEIVSLKH